MSPLRHVTPQCSLTPTLVAGSAFKTSRFRSGERGATFVEHIVLIALVGLAGIAAAWTFQRNTADTTNSLGEAVITLTQPERAHARSTPRHPSETATEPVTHLGADEVSLVAHSTSNTLMSLPDHGGRSANDDATRIAFAALAGAATGAVAGCVLVGTATVATVVGAVGAPATCVGGAIVGAGAGAVVGTAAAVAAPSLAHGLSELFTSASDGIGNLWDNITNSEAGSASESGASDVDLPENSLTEEEVAQISEIAEKYNTTIDIVGSRAAGEGRNIDSEYPVGKPESTDTEDRTRSDIDFRIDTTHPQAQQLIDELKRVGQGAGSASFKHGTNHRDTVPPYIRISPDGTTYVGP